MRILLVLVVIAACKPRVEEPRVTQAQADLASHYERALAAHFELTAKVTCPVQDRALNGGTYRLECVANVDGKQLKLTDLSVNPLDNEWMLTSGQSLYFPVVRLQRALYKVNDLADTQIRCPNKYIVVEQGKHAHCELLREGRPVEIVRILLEDIATQKWSWKFFQAPEVIITRLAASAGHEVTVECPRFATPVTSIVCSVTLGTESMKTRAYATAAGIKTTPLDNRGILTSEIKIAGKPLKLKCAKWMPQILEYVRCTVDVDGVQVVLEMAFDKDYKTLGRQVN